MAIEPIVEHIIRQAGMQRDKIIAEAAEKGEALSRTADEEAEKLFREEVSKAERAAAAEKDRIIIDSRMEAKKRLLEAKRALLSSVFAGLKPLLEEKKLMKEQVSPEGTKSVPEEIGFYLEELRQDFESEVAAVLFS